MTLRILKHASQISEARRIMRTQGIDCADGALRRLLKKLHVISGPQVGDLFKSWDVQLTAEFLLENLRRDEPVLDIGAYASEILPALDNKGFSNLTGVDLNAAVTMMPSADRIRYHVGDFYGSLRAKEPFSAITAISVIEHGYEPERLFAEISRLLRPGGYFIASVDYWPEKIDTTGIRVFDLDWIVFSRADLQDLFTTASRYGLKPVGNLDFVADVPLVVWQGKRYTFAWLVVKKAEEH